MAAFHSILYLGPEERSRLPVGDMPAFFRDLNLDQVVETITAARAEFDLEHFFFTPLAGVDSIAYRHEVFHDLESTEVWDSLHAFAMAMRSMREQMGLVDKLHHTYQKERWFLDAVHTYCDAVSDLRLRLTELNTRSEGFRGLRDYLETYVQSPAFAELANDADLLSSELDRVVYCLWIEGNRIHVTNYESDEDYAATIEDVFRKFQQGDVDDHRSKFSSPVEMNHVETGVLDRVALLFPETFAHLDRFAERHVGFIDEMLGRFDREIQFYVSYVEFTRRFVDAGLSFCYPVISTTSKEITARDTFDVALAASLVPHQFPVITNDFAVSDPERIFVVSGPNQGGKTTFARTFGQIHYLGALGLPVPGTAANLFLCDNLFTHFERDEHRNNLSGKLHDDLVRIHDIFDRATPSSIVIMNEIFTSTTYRDALFLSRRVYERIKALDLLCVWVTFIDEVATFGDTTVSMVSTVDPHDPARRTYKIMRRPADGRAYALAIAEKYGLTRDHLKERLAR